MRTLELVMIELRSQLNKIADHIEKLPSAENLSDETYIEILSILQRTIEQQFDYLDSLIDNAHITDFGWMLRFDLRIPLSNLKTAANFIYAKYEDQLGSEQRESAQAIESISEELINYIITL